MNPSPWLDTQQAVAYSGTNSKGKPNISAQVLNRACRNKKIKFGRNGKKYLFKPEFIDDYFMNVGNSGRKS